MTQKIQLSFVLFLLSTITLFGQYSMEVTANYNIVSSSEFNEQFKNGYGGNMEIIYQFQESGFGASILFGLNGFRAEQSYEQKLADNNPTIFTYEYKINYYSFPLMAQGKYTFFREKDFNILAAMGLGMEFMELKEKQFGKYTSDYRKEKFNEFAIYPNIGLSYKLVSDVAIVLKSGYHKTFGKKSLSYIDIKLGLIYKI